MAAETITDTHTFGGEGVLWDSQWGSWSDSVSWTHTLDGLGSGCQITEATLAIDGRGIDNIWWDRDGDGGYEQTDAVRVSLGGHELGLLSGNHTVFSLSPDVISDIATVTAANAVLTFQKDGRYDFFDTVFLRSSTLSVTCGPVAVPVPGALVLAGLGTVLVGALRRRKNA